MKREVNGNHQDRLVDLLEKSLAVQLHAAGAPQNTIAKMMGKRAKWVNDFLKPLSRRK